MYYNKSIFLLWKKSDSFCIDRCMWDRYQGLNPFPSVVPPDVYAMARNCSSPRFSHFVKTSRKQLSNFWGKVAELSEFGLWWISRVGLVDVGKWMGQGGPANSSAMALGANSQSASAAFRAKFMLQNAPAGARGTVASTCNSHRSVLNFLCIVGSLILLQLIKWKAN